MKSFSILGGLLIALFSFGCQTESTETSTPAKFAYLQGETMGTFYKVIYEDKEGIITQQMVDDLLAEINQEVSTYIPNSIISTFNQGIIQLDLTDFSDRKDVSADFKHFKRNLKVSKDVFELTDGNFDPTVMPLVNFWGFGYQSRVNRAHVDENVIDSLKALVGFDKIQMQGNVIAKTTAESQLDFSAVAKGYAVDEVGRMLESKGIQNYMIDIGGEIKTKGHNAKGHQWTIGINTPHEDAALQDVEKVLAISDKAIATSGNYRNYYKVEGQKFAHTINPKTGYSEISNTLSATIVADDCATADALATACMVMGAEKGVALIETIPDIEALCIIGNEDGSMSVMQTAGMAKWIKE